MALDEDSDDDYWGQYGDREDTPVAKGSKDNNNDDDIFSSAPMSPLVTFSTTLPWAPTVPSVVVDGQDEDDEDDEYWQKYGDHSEDEEDEDSSSDSAHSLHEEGAVGFETRRIFTSVDPLTTATGETCPGGISSFISSQVVPAAPVPVLGVNPNALASLLERLVVEEEDKEEDIPDGDQAEDKEEHVSYNQHEGKRFPLFPCVVGQEQEHQRQQGHQGRGELDILEGDNNHNHIQGQDEEGQQHPQKQQHEGILLSFSVRSRLQSLSGPASEVIHRSTTMTTTKTTTPLSLSEGALSGMVVQDQKQHQQPQQQAPQQYLAHLWDLSQTSTPHSSGMEEEEQNLVSEKENNRDDINNVGMKHGEADACSGTFRSRSSSSSTVVSDPFSVSISMSKAQILDSLRSLTALALQAGLSKADLAQMLESVS